MSRKSRKAVTAAELLAELEADPAWVAARDKRERERQERATTWRRAEEPLVGVAVALAAVARRDVLDELVALVEDTEHGSSRVLLIRGLTRSRHPNAWAAVERLQDDPDVGAEARKRVAVRSRRAAV